MQNQGTREHEETGVPDSICFGDVSIAAHRSLRWRFVLL